MTEKDTGGQAFPVCGNSTESVLVEGVTKRDYFAAKAMQAILSNPHVNSRTGPMCEANPINIAAWSYEQADAMLKEREK